MALIRCKKCGNPASSRSKACPVCGEPISEQTTQPTHMDSDAPKTLNDIIAERATAPRTLNDMLRGNEPESKQPTEPTAQPSPEMSGKKSEENSNKQLADTPDVKPAEEAKREGGDVAEETPYQPYVGDYEEELMRRDRSIKGFKTLIILLAILLIPALYFSISWGLKVKAIEEDYAIVESARKLFEEQNTMLQHDAESLVAELEELKDRNDTMMVKYQEAVVMLEQLQREKTYNYEQLARYKKEVNTLRSVMKGYLRQIDSLNTINNTLQAQNVAYKKEITTAQLRADVAEEKADELDTKVRIGAVIRSSGIRMVALNDRSKVVKRIKQATRLRVDFELTANELAEPGEKSIYICITSPDGYVLSPAEMIFFTFEGEDMMASAMRKVDYENQSVPVSIFYDGSAFERGTYKVDIYIDGRHSGSQESYFE